jgi:hypothetical protein
MRVVPFVIGALLLGRTDAGADAPPDLAKIPRQIKKQPAYKAKEPLYGLYAFGPEAKTRVWAVLDKSAVDREQYDVLYFDRDADGDLTDENERTIGHGRTSRFRSATLWIPTPMRVTPR